MNYADEIRRRAEDAPRVALPAIASATWKAFGEGHLTEAEAEALSGLIEVRQASATQRGENAGLAGISNMGLPHISRSPDLGTSMPAISALPSDHQRNPRTGAGSRPRTDASLERRRRWSASGRLPPALAAKFTLAEQAVLSLIAAETARKGDCRLAIEHIAAVAGVSRSTVKAAIREARKLGLLTVEERRVSAFRNDTNVVRIVSPEWVAWLRIGRRSPNPGTGLSLSREQKGVADRYPLGRDGITNRYPIGAKGVANRHLLQGGGVKFSTSTPTQVTKQGKTRTAGAPQGRFARPCRVS